MDNLHHRKQLRLKNYNYSQSGYYFVTICTHDRQNLLRNIAGCGSQCPSVLDLNTAPLANMELTEIGMQIENSILNIPSLFACANIDQYIIMPNHLHIIIVINGKGGHLSDTGGHGNPPLQDIIGRFKSFTTYEYNKIYKTNGNIIWQRDFYEHIIRNEYELQQIREYISNNLAKWLEDEYYGL